MGAKHSAHDHNKQQKPPKTGKQAVFHDDNNEAIFKPNFGLGSHHRAPSIRPAPKVPAVPISPPPATTPLPSSTPQNHLLPVPFQTEPQSQPHPKTSRSLSNFDPPPPTPPRHHSKPPPIPEHSSTKLNRSNGIKGTKSLPILPPETSTKPASPKLSAGSGGEHNFLNERPLFIAKHRFVAKSRKEVSLEEGDLVYLLNPMKGDWWYVETKSGFQGFVPTTHVKRVEVREPWYAGNISRITAERRIMQPNLPIGTFLIREKELNRLVLTVKNSEDSLSSYMIYKNEHESGYYMKDDNDEVSITFFSLQQIVDVFSKPGDIQLCTLLKSPAPPLDTRQDDNYSIMTKWEISRDALKIWEKIGEGQFGEVNRATWKNIDVAVKKMKSDNDDPDEYKQFVDEARILTNLAHPNLIRLLAVCTKKTPYYIITEYMRNGSLLAFLQKDLSINKLNTESAMNIAAQIAAGMQYLVDNNIVHRDLAARNVLVGDFSVDHIPHVKIADFGLARKVDLEDPKYDMKTDLPVAVKWMAPEVYETQSFNQMTDVWSFGILIWEIGSLGEKPYKEWSAEYTMQRVRENYKLPAPKAVPKYVYDEVFLACVDLVPENRPSFSQLFQYFDDFTHIAPIERSRIRLSRMNSPF